eukprot:jgi/Bigna1/86737/estExt_fgenesh1_pg.C_130120
MDFDDCDMIFRSYLRIKSKARELGAAAIRTWLPNGWFSVFDGGLKDVVSLRKSPPRTAASIFAHLRTVAEKGYFVVLVLWGRLALKVCFGEKTKEYSCRGEITVAEFLRNACVEMEVAPQYSPANEITNLEFEMVSPKSTTNKGETGFAIKPKHYDQSLSEIGIQSGKHLMIRNSARTSPKETKTSTSSSSSKPESKKHGTLLQGKTKQEAVDTYMPVLEEILTKPGSTTIEASEILPYLYIGGKPAAEECLDRGNSLRFTHILNCAEPWCPMASGKEAEKIKYAGIEARDHV